ILLEDKGDLGHAEKQWQQAQAEADGDHIWGLVIQMHLSQIQSARQWETHLNDIVTGLRQGKPYEPASEQERKAADAGGLEALEDFVKARERWVELKVGSSKNLEQRPLLLLASKKVADLADKAMPGKREEEVATVRLALVRERLELAGKNLREQKS